MLNKVHFGDCLETLRRMPDGVAHTCVTSPPYFGLRDYGHPGQIGLEKTPDAFIARLVDVFREVRRVLREDGTAWVNIGDSYAGQRGSIPPQGGDAFAGRARAEQAINRAASFVSDEVKPKDLIGVPWMLAFALRADGWYLRQDIIWSKPNPMPESVSDRCTKAHEYIFLLSKSARYYYDATAIREGDQVYTRKGTAGGHHLTKQEGYNGIAGGTLKRDPDEARGFARDITTVGANKRSVWTVTTKPYSGAHFATFPEDLIEPCILAGSPAGGVVLDPFMGSGTTAAVAMRLGRQWIGCELNPEYEPLQRERLRGQTLGLELA